MALGQAAEDLDDLDRSVAIASWDFRHDGVRRDADLSKRREDGREDHDGFPAADLYRGNPRMERLDDVL